MNPPENEKGPGGNRGGSNGTDAPILIRPYEGVNNQRGFDPSKIHVTSFASAKGKKPTDVCLADLLSAIRTGKYAAQIAELRAYLPGDRKRYNHEKKQLLAFTMSGTAKSRTEPNQHSNLLQVDLDKLGGRLPELRERLKHDPHVVFGFVSPSGEGLKLGVVIDGSRHEESFRAATAYFRENHQVEIDQSCKDRLRLCFVSDDPELWQNPGAKILPITDKEITPINSSESCILNTCVTESLNPCITASLHNTPEYVLANIKQANEARKALAAKYPNIIGLYTNLIEHRFHAHAHARNAFLVQAVPFLYRAVAPRIALEFVGWFYDCNRALFNDPREQHMTEATAMLELVDKSYSESLSTDEREIYKALVGEHESDAFRICRDLALREAPNSLRGEFFMSFTELGNRLGIHPMQAQRTMRRLAGYGLIKLTKKGTRRAAGVRGEAGEYQWRLSLSERGTP